MSSHAHSFHSLYSCRPLLLATYNPEEGPLREHLLDRISISLSADVPIDFDERVAAVEMARRFQDDPSSVIEEVKDVTESTVTQV